MDHLWTAAGPADHRACAWYVKRSQVLGIGPMTFAVLAIRFSGGLVREALDANQPVIDWVTMTAWAAIGDTQPPPQPYAFPTGATLHVDPRLPELPYLDHAHTHTSSQGRLLGVYVSDELPPALGGRCTCQATVTTPHGQADASTIEIALNQTYTWPWTIEVWLHELGHLLDPRHHPRSPEEIETYAITLGKQLAASPRDLTYDQVIEQAEQTYTQVRQQYINSRPEPIERPLDKADTSEQAQPTPTGPSAALPAPGLESLIHFNALPLLAEQAA
jgi:hypothetical protein